MHPRLPDTRSVRRFLGLGIALVFSLTLVAAGVVTLRFREWPLPLATFPATALIGFVVVGLSPLLIVLSRESVEYQRPISRIVLVCSLLLLLWLDAAFVVLALGVEHGAWWLGHAAAAGFLSAVLVGVAPYHRRARLELLGGLAAIWIWAAVLPWIPWHRHKRLAMDGWRVQGATTETVQQVMADYYVDELWAEGDWGESRKASHHDDTRVRDLDLGEIGPCSITLVPGLQGCRVDLDEGVVVSVSFLID